MSPAEEEGYAGDAELFHDGTVCAVQVELRGHFQPIDGRYHWYGRVAASPEVDALAASGASVVLRTPEGEATGKMSDRDPWGRFRITGTGRPPYSTD